MSIEQVMLAVGGLLSAMSLAVVALYRQVLLAQASHIATLTRELAISQQREEEWKRAAFDSFPIMQAGVEGLTEAVSLVKKRGTA